jgi:hypothetical protein
MEPTLIDGLIEFPWHLPLDVTALGMTINIQLNGKEVHLTLPMYDSDESRALVAPPSVTHGVMTFAPRSTFWGLRTSDSVYMMGEARLEFSVLPDSDPLPAELKEMDVAFTSWRNIVEQWAAAWSRELWPTPNSVINPSIQAKWPDGRIISGGFHVTARLMPLKPLDAVHVEAVFVKASRNERLPIEHALLLTARSAQVSGNYRQACIDSGTAAEASLAGAIKEMLSAKEVDEEYIDKSIVNANGIVGLIRLCGALGKKLTVSANKAADGLARSRNEAAHAGSTPSPEDTLAAVQQARSLIEEASPLPSL